MGVEVENYESVPALDYKYFFMERMEVVQDKLYSSVAMPKFSMNITYRMYAVDHHGVWHYQNKVNTIVIDNYMELAIMKAQSQDTDLLETAAVLEYAVAKIAEEMTSIGNTEIV